jgi:xanthine dehydrogenase YagS FAD-binding subunit
MNVFELRRANAIGAAFEAGVSGSGPSAIGRFIAGGTTLVDLMHLEVERPNVLVDLNHLPFAEIERTPGGGLRIGALVRNADLAQHAIVKRDFAVLSEALLSGASAQLRNAATTGGNVLQRTRCVYFRDAHSPCNKREPGSGCPAIAGYNRNLAVLGTSQHCIATNPSDMNVALSVLDATLELQTAAATRSLPFRDFYVLPGAQPEIETVLAPNELIVAVTLPAPPAGTRSTYVKLRDRASYEFALASAAVALKLDGGALCNVRIALGGVGTRPWPALAAEQLLEGQAPTPERFRAAADAALLDAVPQSQNAFKLELVKRAMVAALTALTADARA